MHTVSVDEWRFSASGEYHSQWEIRTEVCDKTPLASPKRSDPYAFNSEKRYMRLPLMRGSGYQITDD